MKTNHSVLIIEDDAVIADDLETIICGMGHEVTGNADTHAAAVAMAMERKRSIVCSTST